MLGLELAVCKRRRSQRNEVSEAAQPERRRQLQTEAAADAVRTCRGGAIDDLAKHEYLIDVIWKCRFVRMLTAIKNRQDFNGAGLESGFLLNFPDDVFGGRFTNIRPSTRDRLAPIRPLSDQQVLVCLEHDSAYINFRCGIA